MQILDIKIMPSAEPDALSQVRFIGEGGDEVAVTMAKNHDGGASIEQELFAKAKVMLLHAAAAQVKEYASSEPETIPLSEVDEDGDDAGLQSMEEEDDNPFQNPDEALPSDEAEEAIARDPDRSHGWFGE